MVKNKVGVALVVIYLAVVIGVSLGHHYEYLMMLALPLNPVLTLLADYNQFHTDAFEFLSMVVSIIFNVIVVYLLSTLLERRRD